MPVIMHRLSVRDRKILNVKHQPRNRKVNEEHLVIMVNYFSLKRSIFNK
jgi:hypothetical protein